MDRESVYSENPVQMDTMNALGAMPIALPLPEAYSSFQTGVAQGSFGEVGSFVIFKWAEVLKYVSLMPLFPSGGFFLGSTRVLSKLSPEQQQVIREAAGASCRFRMQSGQKRRRTEQYSFDNSLFHNFKLYTSSRC
jgi:TRAP-type C4-dicarboxylate transport system substrate-binding protein